MVLASAINCALYNLLVRLLVRLNAPGIKDFVFAIAAPSSDCGEEAFTPAQKKARWIHPAGEVRTKQNQNVTLPPMNT